MVLWHYLGIDTALLTCVCGTALFIFVVMYSLSITLKRGGKNPGGRVPEDRHYQFQADLVIH